MDDDLKRAIHLKAHPYIIYRSKTKKNKYRHNKITRHNTN